MYCVTNKTMIFTEHNFHKIPPSFNSQTQKLKIIVEVPLYIQPKGGIDMIDSSTPCVDCTVYFIIYSESLWKATFIANMITRLDIIILFIWVINTFKYVFAPMGRFQLELIYLYFPPYFHQTVIVSVL